MEGEKTFPMTEEGRLDMKRWLEENIPETGEKPTWNL